MGSERPAGVRIREAEPADAPALAELHVRAWRGAYRGQLSDEFLDGLRVEDWLERHRRALEQPPPELRTWVAEDGARIVGFAVTGRSEDGDADERVAEVYAIYLDPERVGTGLGRVLFEHSVRDLADRGFETATLWVLESNARARRFYERAGWRLDGTASVEHVDCEMRPTVRYRVALA
jgi:ribosomal protein S18 acetylase RimI-like enzyme